MSQKKKSRKQSIQEAALTLFATQGFHATTIEAITEAAEVSKGLFYFHFKNKEQLLKVLMNSWLDQFWGNIFHKKDEEKSALVCMELTIDTLLLSLKKEEQYFRLFLSLSLINPHLFSLEEAHRKASYGHLNDYFYWLFDKLGATDVAAEVMVFKNVLFGLEMNFLVNSEDRDANFENAKKAVMCRYR
jgi:AcrR family transcriptional regulator